MESLQRYVIYDIGKRQKALLTDFCTHARSKSYDNTKKKKTKYLKLLLWEFPISLGYLGSVQKSVELFRPGGARDRQGWRGRRETLGSGLRRGGSPSKT
ncbi:hypothetical protein ElyMa_004034100 [Elysia marginata]|uniref:Uncharacterized protein n=1 Tax=Elysia marginata TaxID=1093978 RepID=A0AAV4G5I1_9GAST|nr:hypothetical protein ElyMa_004034100 [Elysia marginata]